MVIHHKGSVYHNGVAHEVEAEVEAEVCSECDATFLDGEADRVLLRAFKRNMGLLQAEEIKALRQKYELTQSKVSELTGIAEATLSRWERFNAIQSVGSDRLLRYFFEEQEKLQSVRKYVAKFKANEFGGSFSWSQQTWKSSDNKSQSDQVANSSEDIPLSNQQYAIAA